MKMRLNQFSKRGGLLLLLLLIAAVVVACGGGEAPPEPTSAPAATTVPAATTAPADDPEAQPESPLGQPESPLLQPESPLTTSGTSTRLTEEQAIEIAAMTEAPEPVEGFGTLSAVVFSYGQVAGVVPGTQVYLEKADEVEGKFYPRSVSFGPGDDSIIVETTRDGQVLMEQIEPGHYYLAVWTIYNWLLASAESGEELPRLITIEPGDQLNLGVLYVNWP